MEQFAESSELESHTFYRATRLAGGGSTLATLLSICGSERNRPPADLTTSSFQD